MGSYTELVKQVSINHQPSYGFSDINSLLELLWSNYTEYNPIYNDTIREKFRQLLTLTDGLPKDLTEELFDRILDLYGENERESFLEGVRVGIRLAMELCEEP